VGAEATTIPIGRPIANTRIHLLEADRMRPVPVGVPGELCIGGDGLAWGYLDRPELTGACFVPDPWSGEPGARLYRTGDLGRYRPDGSIEFLGRRDHQIKLRGNRIELEEIESVLRSSHAIHDAAVVHRGDGGGGRLVAYVAAKNRDEMDASAVRTHLRTRLPEYMLPAEIVFVADLPLTVNGKVDRAALAALGAPAAGRGPDPALPESELQRQLAAVWSNVLGAEHVGLHENFFDLGGHSLLVVRILNRLRLELGRSVTVAEFFKHPTVAGLADFLEGRERELRIDDIRGRASRQLASLSAQRNRKATETGR